MFYLEEVQPKIFKATFYNHYHLANACKRFSESFETDDPRWDQNAFKMEDFVEHYSRSGEGYSDTYADDWAGFNLPSLAIKDTISRGMIELTKWDQIFLSMYTMCLNKYPDSDFCIICISLEGIDDDVILLQHEMAHAFYALDLSYRYKMNKLFNKIPPYTLDRTLQILKGWGYGDGVLVDEVQAYLSTGVKGIEEFDILQQNISLKDIQNQFSTVFQSYTQSKFKRKLIFPHLD